MDVEKLLRETFVSREMLAPDSDDMFDAITTAVSRRERHPRRAVALVGCSVLAATGIIVGVQSLTSPPVDQMRDHADPASVGSNAQPTVRTRSGTAARAAIAPLSMPFDLGWLPPGQVHHDVRRVNDTGKGRYLGEYLLTISTPSGPVKIGVAEASGVLADVGFKSGRARAVLVTGRRGVEASSSSSSGLAYELYVRESADRLIYVDVRAGQDDRETELVKIGRRIASTIRLPGVARVMPTFGLGQLPSGWTVRTFEVGDVIDDDARRTGETHTGYEVGPAGRRSGGVTVGTNFAQPEKGRAGRKVQGHPTLLSAEAGYSTLVIRHAVAGRSVVISGRVPVGRLYSIAAQLRLPG